MSTKNIITIADILDTIDRIPVVSPLPEAPKADWPLATVAAHLRGGSQPVKAITQPRIVLYRFTGTMPPPADVILKALAATGPHPLKTMAEAINADLDVIDLDTGEAPTPDVNARAAAFGMMAPQQGTDMLVLSAFGCETSNADIHNFNAYLGCCTPAEAAIIGAITGAMRAQLTVCIDGDIAIKATKAVLQRRPDWARCVYIATHGRDLTLAAPQFTDICLPHDWPAIAATRLAANVQTLSLVLAAQANSVDEAAA